MFPCYEKSVTKAWLNTHKQRVRKDELFMRIQPSLRDRFFISWKRNLLFCILYTSFSIFQKKREAEKTRKSKKEKIIAYLYTGRQEIISSLVRYVTAHDTDMLLEKSSSGKNHISLVKYFTPHDTKFILLQNNRKLMLGI